MKNKTKTMNENIFKSDAKTIVDMLFDGSIFKDGITRDDMNIVEEFICSNLESRFNSHLKANEIMERVKKTKP